MFLGCSPCCGDDCVDLDSLGPSLSTDLYRLSGAVTLYAERVGMEPFAASATPFNFLWSAATASYPEQTLQIGVQQGLQDQPRNVPVSTTWSLNLSIGRFSALDAGVVLYLNQENVFVRDGFNSYERRGYQTAFRQLPCFRTSPGLAPGERYRNLEIERDSTSNILAIQLFLQESTVGRAINVHDSLVQFVYNGSADLYALPTGLKLFSGPRVPGSTLAGAPGSMPWRFYWAFSPTLSSPVVITYVLEFRTFEFIRDGATIDMDLLSFGDTPGDIEIAGSQLT